MKKDENNYFKDRAVCKTCYNKIRGKNINVFFQNQQPKIENVSNRTLLNGPSFFGKTYLMLKIL